MNLATIRFSKPESLGDSSHQQCKSFPGRRLGKARNGGQISTRQRDAGSGRDDGTEFVGAERGEEASAGIKFENLRGIHLRVARVGATYEHVNIFVGIQLDSFGSVGVIRSWRDGLHPLLVSIGSVLHHEGRLSLGCID